MPATYTPMCRTMVGENLRVLCYVQSPFFCPKICDVSNDFIRQSKVCTREVERVLAVVPCLVSLLPHGSALAAASAVVVLKEEDSKPAVPCNIKWRLIVSSGKHVRDPHRPADQPMNSLYRALFSWPDEEQQTEKGNTFNKSHIHASVHTRSHPQPPSHPITGR